MSQDKFNVKQSAQASTSSADQGEQLIDHYKHEDRQAILQAIYRVTGRPDNLVKARVAHMWKDRFQVDFFCEVQPTEDDGTGFGLSNKLIDYGIVPSVRITQHHFLRFNGAEITFCDPPLQPKKG